MRKNKEIERLEKELQKYKDLALTDELTGLYNRRKLNKDLKTYHIRTLRYNQLYTLILIDVDDFKAINDRHGHDVGDMYLKTIAEILLNNIRTGDNVYRLGGDEFVMLCCQNNNPIGIIGRIRQDLKEHYIKISYGCSTLKSKQALKIADKHMYSHKKKHHAK